MKSLIFKTILITAFLFSTTSSQVLVERAYSIKSTPFVEIIDETAGGSNMLQESANLKKLKYENIPTTLVSTQTNNEQEPLLLGTNYMGSGYDIDAHRFIATGFTIQPIDYVDGIDISNWQNPVGWPQVAGDDLVFSFIKATEGAGYDDPLFSSHMSGAASEGIPAGPYHFARPDLLAPGNTLKQDAKSEARYFSNAIQSYLVPGNLRPVLDFEVNGNLTWTQLSSWVRWFMDEFVSLTGIEPIIYISSYYANNLDADLSKYDLWIAHWTYDLNVVPNIGNWGEWLVWQYSNSGTVSGISGRVDMNVSHTQVQDRILIN